MKAEQKILVIKFGGTSVGTAAAMKQAVQIIVDTHVSWPNLVVVTSALSGVTDLLISSAKKAVNGDMGTFYQTLETLRIRHSELIDALIGDRARQIQVRQDVGHLIDEFSNLCQAIRILGEASPRALDAVAGLGERLSVRVLSAAVDSAGVPSQYIESTQLVVTDAQFQNAVPDMAATTEYTRQVINPLLAQGRVPIVTGFLGATPAGVTTTLGRGGSDYSASILGVALGAAEVWIWTDVDGVMTADPRLVPDARTISQLSYREVAEMANFGAKVLHPKSIRPAIEAGISLRVCNTFNPNGPDTRLTAEETNGKGAIKAVTAIRGLTLVTLAGRGMMGVPGLAGRVFSAVASTGVSVPLIIQSSSEQSICFAAPKEAVPQVERALREALSVEFQRRDIDQVWASEEVAVITVISPGMRSTPGVAGRIYGALGEQGLNILATAYGASDISINLIVSAEDAQPALRVLHALIA